MSFGDRIERELQQLREQTKPVQANDVQTSEIQSDKQISRKSNVSIKAPVCRVLQAERTSESEPNKNSGILGETSTKGTTGLRII